MTNSDTSHLGSFAFITHMGQITDDICKKNNGLLKTSIVHKMLVYALI